MKSETSSLLNTAEAAKYLTISPDTLRLWRSRRGQGGPRFIKLHPRCVRYRIDDLEFFLESRAVRPRTKQQVVS